MIIELIKEEKPGRDTWYTVNVDAMYKFGSYNLKEAEEIYEKLLKNPTALDIKIITLKSEEINLPLQETNE